MSKVKNILAFASDDHAKAFLAFHGLQIVIDKAQKENWDWSTRNDTHVCFLRLRGSIHMVEFGASVSS